MCHVWPALDGCIATAQILVSRTLRLCSAASSCFQSTSFQWNVLSMYQTFRSLWVQLCVQHVKSTHLDGRQSARLLCRSSLQIIVSRVTLRPQMKVTHFVGWFMFMGDNGHARPVGHSSRPEGWEWEVGYLGRALSRLPPPPPTRGLESTVSSPLGPGGALVHVDILDLFIYFWQWICSTVSVMNSRCVSFCTVKLAVFDTYINVKKSCLNNLRLHLSNL